MQESAPSRTAEVVCLFRALEHLRPPDQRVVDDPYAALFLGRSLKAALAAADAAGDKVFPRLQDLSSRFLPGLAMYIVTRHRFIDEALATALGKHGADRFDQVVLLGAGYDTRAYRFAGALAGRPVFEIDFPSTGKRKDDLVRKHAAKLPGSVVRRVEVDFLSETFDGPLARSGFQRGARTFWVWEGVSMYLTRLAVRQTLQMIRALSSPGSELCLDFWFLLDAPDARSAAHRFSANLLQLLGEPVLFGIHPDDTPDFLAREGLRAEDIADANALQQRYVLDGRSVYPANFVARASTR